MSCFSSPSLIQRGVIVDSQEDRTSQQIWCTIWGSFWIHDVHLGSRWQIWLGGFCIDPSCIPIVPIPGPVGLSRNHSALDYFLAALPQWVLHEDILEDHPECSGALSFGTPWFPILHPNIYVLLHELCWFPALFQVQFKVQVILYDTEPASLWDYLFQGVSVHTIWLDRVDTLQVPSPKYQLGAPRSMSSQWRALPCGASSPPGFWQAHTLLSQKGLKSWFFPQGEVEPMDCEVYLLGSAFLGYQVLGFWDAGFYYSFYVSIIKAAQS